MSLEENIFKRAKIDFNKLEQYGFQQSENEWIYSKTFMNGDFRAVIKISESGIVSGNVYETDSDDIYVPLRVESMAAGFAGEVRGEYEKILQDIMEKCCRIKYFVFPQANRLCEKIREKYGDNPCFPWEKFNGHGVFKNPQNNKWYALIMCIDAAKIDKNLCGKIEVVNIKLSEDKIPHLHTEKGFYPAYHMNKKSWITIVLNDTVVDDMLFKLLDESHGFTVGKQSKNRSGKAQWLIPANPQYFDIGVAFTKQKEIIWKQSSDIKVGDILYMYVGAPVSAVLYKCEATAVDIPYDYADKNIKINKVMKIKRLKKYPYDFMPFARLKDFKVNSVRGPRICPQDVVDVLK